MAPLPTMVLLAPFAYGSKHIINKNLMALVSQRSMKILAGVHDLLSLRVIGSSLCYVHGVWYKKKLNVNDSCEEMLSW